MASHTIPLLPDDMLESQLANVDLLIAMFPDGSGVAEPSAQTVDLLKAWTTGDRNPATFDAPPSILLYLALPLDDPESHELQVDVSVPIRSKEAVVTEAPHITYRLKQPAWLTKAQVTELSASMPEQDIFAALEYLQEQAPNLINSAQLHSPPVDQGPVVRAWFYFPSLSTRAKRDDLVLNAPVFSLTGFVLAGKPGVLCLEGTSLDIDKYMQYIKTASWGDIPSHQKKVSERYRETAGVQRVFTGMEEITDASFMGVKGGQRGNRGDMQSLEAWLKYKGLGDAFGNVIF